MIIGIAGKARAGKDTAADYLAEATALTKVSFASNVKKTAMAMFGLSEAQVYGRGVDREAIVEPWGISIREILQKIGTECGREVFRQDIWQVRLYEDLMSLGKHKHFIVSDVRFNNEAAWVQSLGGFVINIVRPSSPTVGAVGHASEQGVTVYDASVANDGSVEDLYSKLYEVIDGRFNKV